MGRPRILISGPASPAVGGVCAGRDAEDLEQRLVRGTPLERHAQILGLRSREQIAEDFLSADLFVLPSHYDAMPLALLRLLCDPARREAMGRANRELAERAFSLTRYADRVDALYRSLLGPCPLPGAQPADGGRATS